MSVFSCWSLLFPSVLFYPLRLSANSIKHVLFCFWQGPVSGWQYLTDVWWALWQHRAVKMTTRLSYGACRWTLATGAKASQRPWAVESWSLPYATTTPLWSLARRLSSWPPTSCTNRWAFVKQARARTTGSPGWAARRRRGSSSRSATAATACSSAKSERWQGERDGEGEMEKERDREREQWPSFTWQPQLHPLLWQLLFILCH